MAVDLDRFWQLPPVSRTLVSLTAVQSILVHGRIVGYHRFVFYYPWVVKIPPEIWRVITPFFLTGGGISMLFDLFFLWTYSSGLETQSPRFNLPGDYFTFIVFASTIIVILSGFFLSSPIFLSALILSLTYIFAQDNRNKKVTFIIFPIPAQYLPWCMLAAALVMGGPYHAMCEATGLVAAHAYDFLTRIYPTFQGGRNVIQTPRVIRSLFGGDRSTWGNRAYGSAYRPSQQSGGQAGNTSTASGWTNPLTGTWRSRGTGRRLGGD